MILLRLPALPPPPLPRVLPPLRLFGLLGLLRLRGLLPGLPRSDPDPEPLPLPLSDSRSGIRIARTGTAGATGGAAGAAGGGICVGACVLGASCADGGPDASSDSCGCAADIFSIQGLLRFSCPGFPRHR